jgi:cytochrome oxidase Cu insertion factor (SCO1/SenC/PrrC family)
MVARMLAAVILAAVAAGPAFLSAADPAGAAEKRATRVRTGDVAPDFTLPDQDGRNHSLSAERGKRPVVLIFYRGYW